MEATKTPKQKKQRSREDIENKAIEIVRWERDKWSDATVFVTDRVAFQMRNLIRVLRKNYWGIFDVKTDPMTGRDKVFVPLTRVMCEGTVKNTDLDTKDINFRAKNDKGYAITKLIRALVRKVLDMMYFGEHLDEMERNLSIDGTVVWKFIDGYVGKKKSIVKKAVDLLNVYIDPNEDNIQSAFRFTERALMLPSEIEQMSGWQNTKDLVGSSQVSRIDGQYQSITTGTTAKFRDVWEMWGKIPESLVTGTYDPDGDDDLIDGHIVISGLEASAPKCHLIEKNTKTDTSGLVIKPYEEVRYSKVANRWYGLGIAERCLMLQIWLNTIVNIRINRSYVSQLGLFKIRKGSGITPQMLSRLGANGAIVVKDPTDIEQMAVDEASEASYRDEENIINWAQRDTGAFDVSVGEPTPASKPATTSVIENNSAKSGFKLVKDAIGSFLERCIDRHMLPIIASNVDIGDIIEVSDMEDMEVLAESIVAYEAYEKLEDDYKKKKTIPTAEKLQAAMEEAKIKILKRDNIFMKCIKKLIADHVYTKVYVTNEEMDPAVMVQNIMGILRFVPPEGQMPIVKEAMDLMGLDFNIPKPQPQAPQNKVSESISFKDLPPEGQVQMAEQAGIKLSPNSMSSMMMPGTGMGEPSGAMPMPGGGMNNPQPLATQANVIK